jgi:hypothetical protein
LEKRNAIESLANPGRHFDLVFLLTKKLVVPKHFGKKLNGQDKPLKERRVLKWPYKIFQYNVPV